VALECQHRGHDGMSQRAADWKLQTLGPVELQGYARLFWFLGIWLRWETYSVSASSRVWSAVTRLSWTSSSNRISIKRASIFESRRATGCTTAATTGGILRRRSVFAFRIWALYSQMGTARCSVQHTLASDADRALGGAHREIDRHQRPRCRIVGSVQRIFKGRV
jgi:hypothetical protein